MNVLVVGGDGQLGSSLQAAMWPSGCCASYPTLSELDLTKPEQVQQAVQGGGVDLAINAAAYTAVDKAESETELAYAVNRDGPAALARACAEQNIPLVHVSTDYVFDGTKDSPYTEDDPISPINVYGDSKAQGEQAVRTALQEHIILRTSWLYSPYAANFVKSMIRLAAERDELRVVNDQHGCPTCAVDLADAIVHLVGQYSAHSELAWGTYHYAGQGETTWCGLAECVFETLESSGMRRPRLQGIPTSEYPTPAKRPRNSRLNCARAVETLRVKQQPWQESCRRVVKQCVAEKQEVAT